MGLWHRVPAIAYLAVFLGVLGHGSSEFVAKIIPIAGPELSVWRFLIGGLGLVILALLIPGNRDILQPLREQPIKVTVLALQGVTVGYLFFHWSLDYATVPQVATMVTTVPIFVGLTNRLLHGERFTVAKLLTGLSALIGVALLLTDGYIAKLAGEEGAFFGVLLALGCAAMVGGYSVAIKPVIGQYGALRMTALTMMMGAIGLWLLVGIAWGEWVNLLALFDREPVDAFNLLVLGLWNTTATQFLWIGGLAAVPDITRGSYLFFLKPVIAAVLAALFLAEPISAMSWIAMVVIVGSVFVEPLLARGANAGR